MSEKVKIVPNPVVEVEEETPSKPKFPTKLVRNVVVGAVGAAIVGYVACKLKSKDEEESPSESTPWLEYIPAPTQTPASGE